MAEFPLYSAIVLLFLPVAARRHLRHSHALLLPVPVPVRRHQYVGRRTLSQSSAVVTRSPLLVAS